MEFRLLDRDVVVWAQLLLEAVDVHGEEPRLVRAALAEERDVLADQVVQPLAVGLQLRPQPQSHVSLDEERHLLRVQVRLPRPAHLEVRLDRRCCGHDLLDSPTSHLACDVLLEDLYRFVVLEEILRRLYLGHFFAMQISAQPASHDLLNFSRSFVPRFVVGHVDCVPRDLSDSPEYLHVEADAAGHLVVLVVASDGFGCGQFFFRFPLGDEGFDGGLDVGSSLFLLAELSEGFL